MKKLNIKEINVCLNENVTMSISFSPEPTGSFYFTDHEVREWEPGEWRRAVYDLSTVALVQPWSFVMLRPERGWTEDVEIEAIGCEVLIDCKKLFAIMRNFRAKGIRKATISIDRLRTKPTKEPVYTFSQMVNHPNCAKGSRIAHTLKNFVTHLKPEFIEPLKRKLSHQLQSSRVSSWEKDELYFDGRQMNGGCGFNGAFILRGDEFSIHT